MVQCHFQANLWNHHVPNAVSISRSAHLLLLLANFARSKERVSTHEKNDFTDTKATNARLCETQTSYIHSDLDGFSICHLLVASDNCEHFA